MRIRPATIADIERCERLDGSYTTSYVWHMDQTVTPDSIALAFRRMRLPRSMEIAYPRSVQDLYENWQRDECFLVADELTTILGYLDLTVSRWQWAGFVEHLVVDRPHRRQGVATRLLRAAGQWARGSGLGRITLALQIKNDPATCLCSSLGYTFCGLIDHYFNNGDLGLLYSRGL